MRALIGDSARLVLGQEPPARGLPDPREQGVAVGALGEQVGKYFRLGIDLAAGHLELLAELFGELGVLAVEADQQLA